MTDLASKILIFGCGNMDSAMLRGWIAGGLAPSRFVVVDPLANDLPKGIAAHRSPSEISDSFDTVFLGIKPQLIGKLAPEIASLLGPGALVVSILAGIETAALSRHFPGARVVRLMPNLAAAIGRSPLGLYSNQIEGSARAALETLLSALGTSVWLNDEAQMDAVTALAGSGPAFVYRFVDALTKGGIDVGLSPDTAAMLALKTVEGAALLAAQSGADPATLAARVTSPGGTTAAGLAVLDKDGALDRVISATLRTATERGAELAKGK